MITKVCSKCGLELSLDMFYKHPDGKHGRRAQCILCDNKDRRRIWAEKKAGTYVSRVRKPRLTDEQRLRRKEENVIYMKNYRQKNKEVINKKRRILANKYKEDGINHYGGKCTCCGESIQEFLTLDHVGGRPEEEKFNRKFRGKKMWMKAKSEGYPDKYTVLCFNCNCAKGAFGYCPHEKQKGVENDN